MVLLKNKSLDETWPGALERLQETRRGQRGMILYDMTDSGNCYKPRLLMAKLGIPFTRVEVSSHTGETRKPDYVAKNPNAMVPMLELDDGRRIAESNAILLYLAEGTRFLPADKYERALAYQWLFFEQYSHEPYIAVRKALLTFPERAKDATPERLAQTLERGNKALGVMNSHLQQNAFFARYGKGGSGERPAMEGEGLDYAQHRHS
jgi:glutathione S-transferase